jgi:hypothetical protein
MGLIAVLDHWLAVAPDPMRYGYREGILVVFARAVVTDDVKGARRKQAEDDAHADNCESFHGAS